LFLLQHVEKKTIKDYDVNYENIIIKI